MSAIGNIFKLVTGQKTEHQIALENLLSINATLKQEHANAVQEALAAVSEKPNGANGQMRHDEPLDDFFGDLKRGSA
jgi:hypothetical protein